MSGTSLDGLDIAACEFFYEDEKWNFRIIKGFTYKYNSGWDQRLAALPHSDALTFARTHVEYGHLLGRLTREFIEKTGFSPDLVTSHGHTIFHRPDQGFTTQIGDGSAIAAETGLPVVCDFRSADVALGGQGAPLVPLGDRLLFPRFDACLNLGGFANISMESESGRIAFDICPVNIVLNRLASELGHSYDKDGEIARSGKIDHELLHKLNDLPYYALKPPKSLGREWIENEFLQVLNVPTLPVKDIMKTVCEHVALQVNLALSGMPPLKVLTTGGGTFNQFLIERINHLSDHKWIVPDDDLINFKEALIFAFLGLMRILGHPNVLKSVTGSSRNHSSGALYRLFGEHL